MVIYQSESSSSKCPWARRISCVFMFYNMLSNVRKTCNESFPLSGDQNKFLNYLWLLLLLVSLHVAIQNEWKLWTWGNIFSMPFTRPLDFYKLSLRWLWFSLAWKMWLKNYAIFYWGFYNDLDFFGSLKEGSIAALEDLKKSQEKTLCWIQCSNQSSRENFENKVPLENF